MTPVQIQTLIESGLPDASVQVAGDDGVHFEALVVSPAFTGKTKVQCHQLVYATLGPRMGTDIHALALKTFTPEQWAEASSRK